MSQPTPRLSLPFIQPAQAQKHVTHNEAIRALDLLVQLSFEDDGLTTPPAAPNEGDCFIVPTGASGAWSGQDGAIAVFLDGAWQYQQPCSGWRGIVLSREALVFFDGTDWAELSVDAVQNATTLGLGMSADTTTPFAAKLNAALWTALYTADGGTGNVMQTINKETAGSDAGIVLQEDFQTRALIGLFGSNLLRMSVTSDGTNFVDGLVIDPANGIVEQPALPRFKATTNYDNAVPAAAWTKVGINSAEYNGQGAFDAATNVFTAPADGTYMFGGTLKYKQDAAATELRARMVVNSTTVVTGSDGREAGAHVDGQTSVWTQSMAVLTAGDTVELQAWAPLSVQLQAGDTVFWGYKIG